MHLITEARTHGVGYYQFSTDGEERTKQQKELEKERKATVASQKERDEQRSAREKIIAARVKAARNRQRARQGLPPLEDEEIIPATDVKDEAEVKKKSEKELEEEMMRELERKQHLRPWDIGKERPEGEKQPEKEWVYKGHKEPMSQNEWNEKKRIERIAEFAPKPPTPPRPPPPPSFDYQLVLRHVKDLEAEQEEEEQQQNKTLFFTSKRKFKPRSYEHVPPIEREEEDEPECKRKPEFAPPATFDYYGPTSQTHPKPPKPGKSDLTSSIEAGLKFLRNQADKGQMGSKSTWSAKADY